MGSIKLKNLVQQRKTIATLGEVGLMGVKQQLGWAAEAATPQLPGPEFSATIPPRSRELVRDFVRHIGGAPSAYKAHLPPHLFPQWSFPVAAKTQRGLPYPLVKMVNGGCRMEVNGTLPVNEPLYVSARLEDIDDNGRRAVLHQRVATGTRDEAEIVVAHIFVVIPLGGGKGSKDKPKKKKQKPLVPTDVRELAYWKIRRDDGLVFASLTGDFNPVHWVAPYAKAFGFKSVILHGFATMARAVEGLNKSLFAGDVHKLKSFDTRFTRPLVLPAEVGLYVKENRVWIGDSAGGPAYFEGTFVV